MEFVHLNNFLLLLGRTLLRDSFVALAYSCARGKISWDNSFSTYAKFSEKLPFIIP